MTAETDALRLVPDISEMHALLEANRALPENVRPIRVGYEYAAYRLMKAAAPAVQPAAGREEPVAWRYRTTEDHGAGPSDWVFAVGQPIPPPGVPGFVVQPLYAHPPAQGSESGPACQRCGGEIHGWCCQSCDAEFPETGLFWSNDDGSESDRPMSYGAAWGSNGERDYMRSVARQTLSALAHPPAQGLSLSFTLEEARANMVQADGTPCFPPRPAALSQPGPASEGDGE
jgi:hypothetical protein